MSCLPCVRVLRVLARADWLWPNLISAAAQAAPASGGGMFSKLKSNVQTKQTAASAKKEPAKQESAAPAKATGGGMFTKLRSQTDAKATDVSPKSKDPNAKEKEAPKAKDAAKSGGFFSSFGRKVAELAKLEVRAGRGPPAHLSI